MFKFAFRRIFRWALCRFSYVHHPIIPISSMMTTLGLMQSVFCNDSNKLAFIERINSIAGISNVTIDIEECKSRSKSLNSHHSTDAVPFLVVKPTSTAQVSEIVKQCSLHSIPIVAYGGGTSLEGQTLATNGGIIIDMSGMNQIIKLNLNDMDVTVQPGLGYLELNTYLKGQGVWFPLDPGPGASIGGMAACRCSGSTAVKYGTMRDNILRMTVVLADGTIVNTGTRARKSAAGYDLTRLFIGSEGTLAIITEITLKLYSKPNSTKAILLEFPSIMDATSAARDFCGGLNCPSPAVSRCELMDESMMQIIKNTSSEPIAKKLTQNACLMIELSDIRASKDLSEDARAIIESAAKYHGSPVLVSSDNGECEKIWRLRKEALWSVMAAYPSPSYECMITDVCVPLSQLPTIINLSKEEIQKSCLPCPIVAHAGDGNFHTIIVFDPNKEEEVTKANSLSDFMVREALRLGGTCTGEHGIGIGKRKYLEDELGCNAVLLMKNIKSALDPIGIMNPGHLLPDPNPSPSIGRKSTGCL